MRFCLTANSPDVSLSSTQDYYIQGVTRQSNFVTYSGAGISISLSAGASETVGWVSHPGIPYSTSWESSGTETVDLSVSTTNADIDLRVRVKRVNSSGTAQATGSYTSYQTSALSMIFNPTRPSWGTVSQTDRLCLEIEALNTAGHGGSKTVSIDDGLSGWETAVTMCGGGAGTDYQNAFYLTNNTSDLSLGGDGTTDITTSIDTTNDTVSDSGATTYNFYFATTSSLPNNDSWEDGGYSPVNIILQATNFAANTATCRGRFISVNSSGTTLQTGSYGPIVTYQLSINMYGALSVPNPTWTHTEACGNRLVLELEITCTTSSTTTSIIMSDGSVGSFIYSPLSKDSGSCGVGGPARRIFIIG